MQEQSIFIEALEKEEPAERAAFLDRVCGPDSVLRQRIERLLQRHQQAGGFLECSASALDLIPPVEEPPVAERPGTVLGPYKLLEQIGEGGFGVVFMAEQTQPVRRKVALKVLKPGMDTRQVVARFEAERQALALMDHPNIAHVFDGGETASGRPYFVMELVRGIPITDFCDANHLPVRPRMELFVMVCQAIQHAHHKGIIHRDIKPSNVLVTLHDGTPVAKVIDFGVAKALGQQLTEKTLFTNFAQMIGTPLYMSPEQAELSGLDVDTRSDIYALGVLLYELLTGTTPFDQERLRTVGYDEIRRIIREEEPLRPSTRLSTLGQAAATVSTQRESDPKQLSQLFRGELDWIVMKCLEKDRGRRYATANGLARDVQRYLADEPVLARPPSVRYRLGKFVRKHRGLVLAASIILVLLVGGILGTSLGFVRAERQRQIAEENERTALNEKANALASAEAESRAKQNETAERKKAEASQRQAMEALRATTDEVIEQLIGMKPALGPAEKAFLENTLKRWQTFAVEKGDGEVARLVRAEGVFRVAYLRAHLGEHDAALAGYREASVLWGKLTADFPAVPPYCKELAASHHNLGNLLRNLGKRAEAEAAYRQALAIQEKLAADFPAAPQYRQDLATSHNNLGILLRDLGKQAEAEAACRQALAIQEKLTADFPAAPQYRQDLATSHNNLGLLLRDLGKRAEAEAAYRQALAIQEKLAADFPAAPQYRQDLATSHNNLGLLLRDLGKRAEADAACRQALAIQEKLAADFPAAPQYRQDLARCYSNLSPLLRDLGKRAEAEAACRQALAIQEKLAADFPAAPQYRQDLAASHNILGNLLRELGKLAEAEAAHRQALGIRGKLAADFPAVPEYREHLVLSHSNLGTLLADLHQWVEAETAYRQALSIQEKLAAEFPAVLRHRIRLGGSLVNLSRVLPKNLQPEQALELSAEAIATLEGVLRQVKVDATARRFLRNAHWVRAETLDSYLKRSAEAVADWDKAVELSPDPEQAKLRMSRAACRARAGQVDAATREAEELARNANADTLYKAACVFGLAAARPEETGGSLSKEECAARAVVLLRQAVAKGLKNAEHMKRDDDLAALRERDDFKKLLAELEKKSP